MEERERKLVEAVRKIRSIIDDGEARGVASWSVLSSIDHEIDCALAAYTEPPNAVFSQEVPLDSRAEFSLGHRKDFGQE